ncbi:MAG: ribonuclease P protein component [Armatimonadetes bacterium]|nr:ribonuclease P protein component [Armatimonadota bacterium]NIM24296.1 ribonuclease P protein component [Armatimonadota bacterium]NIM68165.1 ribonuclease P protein component [Armatimonadota bacterium]NIM76625.1 ribonuclease P protein component [Armatimonadota bacterium]NIN06370.1 ribonuclease P protein component [Armatimonadota bacterium]
MPRASCDPSWIAMERLRAKGEFQEVFSTGRRLSNSVATFMILPREGEGVYTAFSVGKRFGSAVRRNRLKRRLREACRLELAGSTIAGGWSVVCIPRARAAEADFSTLRAALRELLALAGVLDRSN